MTLTELSIKRPILLIVLFTLLTVIGLFSYTQLRYELLPKIASPTVTVTTVYPGAAPSEVEASVTKKIEEAVSGVEKIKRISTSSAESISFVIIEFQLTAKVETVMQEVQRKVNEIVTEFPAGVKTPSVSKFAIDELPVLRLSASSLLPPRDFSVLLKDQLTPRLSQLKGVGQVILSGGQEREIKINVKSDALRTYNLSLLQVVQAIKAANLNVPAGKVKDADRQYSVRVAGKFQTLEDVRNKVIAVSSEGMGGGAIRLRDVAEVEDGQKETVTLSRLDGRNAVGLLIQKQSDANAVEVSAAARAELVRLEEEFQDAGLHFDIASDGSEFTLEAAEAVNHDLLIAIALVALVMLVFLHSLRNALIVMVAIPASLVSAFIAMYLFGFSLNLMTLLAMSLVIGILVDDSIVVLENIYRHLEMGKDTVTASLDGRSEIGFSALSITLVDVVVFLPISLVSGLVGDILREFAIVMVVTTLLSLFVSFTITPMLASRFAKLEHLTKNSLFGRFGLLFESAFTRLTNFYERLLRWSLRNRVIVASVAGLLFIGSLGLAAGGAIGSEFVSASDRGELSVVMELPQGTPLEETNRVAERIEQQLSEMPEVEKVFTTVGASSEGFLGATSSQAVEFNVSLTNKDVRTKSVQEVAQEIKALGLSVAGAKIRVASIGLFGTANDAPIILVMTGANRDSVQAAAVRVMEVVKAVRGTDDVRLSSEEGKPETRVDIDHERLAAYGLTMEEVGYALRTALTGDDDSRFQIGNTEYPIRIALDAGDRATTASVERMSFVNPRGERIGLRQIATVTPSLAPAKLERRNRNNSVVLYAQVVGRASGDVGVEISEALKRERLPSGVRIGYEGDLELQSDSFTSLGLALGAAILFVYLIMVALYNSWVYPFAVLFSIPVALVGALSALALTGKTLSIFSILGIIMLAGLVAKNAILLVDRTNQARAEGLGVKAALLDAGRTRLRPILMTTVAMVIGMFPIATAGGAGAEWKSGLAWALIGGLTSSMFLTLVLVPTVYVDIDRLRQWMEKLSVKFFTARQAASTQVKTDSTGKAATLSILLLLAAPPLFAQSSASQLQPLTTETKSLTLGQAVSIGLEQNAEVRIAKLEREKSGEKIREATGTLLPQLSVSGQYTRNIKAPVFFFPSFDIDAQTGAFRFGALQPIPAGLNNAFSGSVDVRLPLFQWDAYASLRESQAGNKVSEAGYRAASAKLTADIKRAYFTALVAQEQVALIDQSIARAEQALQETRQLYAKGMAADADTLRAFVSLENLRPSRFKVKNEIASSLTALKVLIGLDSRVPIALADFLTPPDSELPNLAAAQQSAAERPEVLQLVYQSDVLDAQLDIENAGRLPTLSAFGQLQVQGQADNFRFEQTPVTSYAGLQLTLPIFSGFKTEARVQQVFIAKQQAELQASYTKRQLEAEVETNYHAALEARERLTAQALTIRAAERSYAQIKSRWLQGLARQSDVRDADLALTQAKTNYIQALYGLRIARIELDRTTGTSR